MDGLIWSIMKNTSAIRRTVAALAIGGAAAAAAAPAANAAPASTWDALAQCESGQPTLATVSTVVCSSPSSPGTVSACPVPP